jgi:hypothetical protein
MTQFISDYVDEYGLIHCDKLIVSENGPLFTSEYYILQSMIRPLIAAEKVAIGKTLVAIYNWDKMKWKDRGGEAGNHFSLDNMLGVYALGKLSDRQPWNIHSGLEYQPTEPHRFYHPKEIGTFAIVEGKWWGWLLFPLMLAQWVWSLTTPKGETSGKILWFVRWWLVSKSMMHLHLWVLSKLYEGGISDVFNIYFRHSDHTIRLLSDKLRS